MVSLVLTIFTAVPFAESPFLTSPVRDTPVNLRIQLHTPLLRSFFKLYQCLCQNLTSLLHVLVYLVICLFTLMSSLSWHYVLIIKTCLINVEDIQYFFLTFNIFCGSSYSPFTVFIKFFSKARPFENPPSTICLMVEGPNDDTLFLFDVLISTLEACKGTVQFRTKI